MVRLDVDFTFYGLLLTVEFENVRSGQRHRSHYVIAILEGYICAHFDLLRIE